MIYKAKTNVIYYITKNNYLKAMKLCQDSYSQTLVAATSMLLNLPSVIDIQTLLITDFITP